MNASALADVQQEWLDHLQRQGKSQHTLRAYRQGLAHFGRWYAGTYSATLTPAEVMPRDVRDWKAYQQAVEKAAPATINQRLVALTRFFRWARAQGRCRENPAEDVGNLRLNPRPPKALAKTALRKLLRAARCKFQYGKRHNSSVKISTSGVDFVQVFTPCSASGIGQQARRDSIKDAAIHGTLNHTLPETKRLE